MQNTFLALALVGDEWVLWILIAASVLSVAVIIERYLVFRKHAGDVTGFMDVIQQNLEKGDLAKAIQTASQDKTTAGRVAAAGLQHISKGAAAVEEVVRAALIRERMLLEKRLIVLGTLGNNAPFVGLFGTVLGIIKAFNDLAMTGQAGVTVVMSGVSAALVATAFGIAVAIPAVVANNYFQTRMKETLNDTESQSRVILAHLKKEKTDSRFNR